MSCYFDLEFQTVFRWAEAHLYFQDISNFDENKNSVKNRGWIHRDTNHWDKRVAFSGLIYLTPDIDLNSGQYIVVISDKNGSVINTQQLVIVK